MTMQFLGGMLVGIAILGGLAAWGFHQWRKGRLTRVPFLPKPPEAKP